MSSKSFEFFVSSSFFLENPRTTGYRELVLSFIKTVEMFFLFQNYWTILMFSIGFLFFCQKAGIYALKIFRSQFCTLELITVSRARRGECADIAMRHLSSGPRFWILLS